MPSNKPLRILGIDTSLRSTGIAVVEAQGSKLSAIAFDRIRNPQKKSMSQCLKQIQEGICDYIATQRPDAAAIEGVFFCKNVRTAVSLGQARGAAIAACAVADIPIFEYAPRRIKQAVVGLGSAGKGQVGKMVMSMLGLSELPQEDAADALAIAICHLHNMTGYAALAPKEI